MSTQPKLLMEGTFESFSIDEVLDVVGLSRQTMEVVLEDEARRGNIVVKAGQVLSANAPPDHGRGAFHSLYQRPGQSFTVWRRLEAPGAPIGTLADLIEESRRAPTTQRGAASRSKRAPLLEGTFSDHSLDEVLDVLSMSRQLMQLAVRRSDGSTAALVVKAGHVLGGVDHRKGTSGRQAFDDLVADPGERFEVVRLKAPPALPASIGTLTELLEAARAAHPDAAAESRPDVMLEGTFSEFSLAEVLDVVALSRQTIEIVFRGRDSTRGAIVVKAGQVLSAQVLRSGAAGQAAFDELMADPGQRFVVLRRTNLRAGDPVGPLAQLFERAQELGPPTRVDPKAPVGAPVRKVVRPPPLPTSRPKPPPLRPPSVAKAPARPSRPARAPKAPTLRPPQVPAPPTVSEPEPTPETTTIAAEESSTQHEIGELVLDGEFSSFSIDEVLDVMGLSRQAMALHTFRDGERLAEVVLKASEVLRLIHGEHPPGVASLTAMLEDPGQTFRVLRLPHRPPAPSLGRLPDLIAEARLSAAPLADDWPTTHRVSQAGTPTIQGDAGLGVTPKAKGEPEPGAVEESVTDREKTEPKVRATIDPQPAPIPREEPTGGGPITRDIVHGPLAQGPATGRSRTRPPGSTVGRITLNPGSHQTIVTHGAPPPANPPSRKGAPSEEVRDSGSRPLYADAAAASAGSRTSMAVDVETTKAVRDLSERIGDLAQAIEALATRKDEAPPPAAPAEPTTNYRRLFWIAIAFQLLTLAAVILLLLRSEQISFF